VLATFGAIPADVIGARGNLEPELCKELTRALIVASTEPVNRALIRAAFGVDSFRRWNPHGYEQMREATMDASSRGLIEGDEKPW
jgi:ABC-type phosphate/phosphonate transport system substrate-binding protein